MVTPGVANNLRIENLDHMRTQSLHGQRDAHNVDGVFDRAREGLQHLDALSLGHLLLAIMTAPDLGRLVG